MKEKDIKNARIESTFLGVEHHGILTATLMLDYGGSGQGFGQYSFGAADKKVTSPVGMEFIRRVLEVVGVSSWEDLPGKNIRVIASWSKVVAIGNFLKDAWFNPEEA